VVPGVGASSTTGRVSKPTSPIRSPLLVAALASAATLSLAQSSGVRRPCRSASGADVDQRDVRGDDLVLEVAHHELPRRAVAFHAMNLNGSPWLCSRSSRSSPESPRRRTRCWPTCSCSAPRPRARAGRARRSCGEHLDRDRVGEERFDVEQSERVAEGQRRAVQDLIAGGERLDRRGDLDLLAALDRRARSVVDLRVEAARMLVDRMRACGCRGCGTRGGAGTSDRRRRAARLSPAAPTTTARSSCGATGSGRIELEYSGAGGQDHAGEADQRRRPCSAPTTRNNSAVPSTSLPRAARRGITGRPWHLVAHLVDRLGDHGGAGRPLELGLGRHQDAVPEHERREVRTSSGNT